MTEVEYVLANFNDHFASLREKRILLHGSRNYAEAILQHFGAEYNFVGVMSMDPLEGESWNGLPVFREEDLTGNRVDLVILTERVKYEEAAFRAIRRICRKNQISVFNMYGLDAFQLRLRACISEPLSLSDALQRSVMYDIVAFEVMDTIFPTSMGQAGIIPNELFTELIPELRVRGKEIRFSLRKSFPEDEQIQALKKYGLFAGESELIRRRGEDLSFRTLKESEPGKRILYFGRGLINEFLLPQCYGIDCIRYLKRNVLNYDCLLPNHAVPDRIPFSPKLRESLLDQIRQHSVISFDIFDTLLIRKTLFPRDVYALTEQKAKKAGYCAEQFASARAGIEDALPFCTLDEIYEDLADHYSWDQKTEEAVKFLELEMERAVLEKRTPLVELLEFARREGKRVVLTSDMYLPETVLSDLLEEKGIRGFERILVSCDCKKAKQDGLYALLLEYGKDAGTILHIGDNPEADGRAPKEFGIDSFVIPSPLSLAQDSPWVHAISASESLMERCLVGMVVCRVFADPFQNPNLWELPITERMVCLGNNVIGPLITGHLSWLIRKLRAGHYDGVLFFARDGWLPSRIYDKIRGALSLPPGFYFLTSRHAAFLCCADDEKQTDQMDDFGKTVGLSINQILERVYLVPPEMQLPQGDRELDSEYIEKHMPIIRKIAERSRRGYRQYLKQLGLCAEGNYAVVDFVAVGNTQKCLSQALSLTMHGFYYANYTFERIDGISVEYYLHGENPAFIQTYLDLESYISSPDPSLDHFSEQGTPVFQAEERSNEAFQAIGTAWDAAESFVNAFFDLFYLTEDSIRPRLIEEMYAAQTYLGVEMPLINNWSQTPHRKQLPADKQEGDAQA